MQWRNEELRKASRASVIGFNKCEEIKAKRKQLGLTQKDFADALGMGKNGDRTLRRWENGESTPSTLEFNSIMRFAERIPFKQEVIRDEQLLRKCIL